MNHNLNSLKSYGWGNNLKELAEKALRISNDIDESNSKELLLWFKDSLLADLESLQETLAIVEALLNKKKDKKH